MKIFKKTMIFFLTFAICYLSFVIALHAAPAVRIKDIAHILGARDNQIMGFGLVVGLKNSGDSQSTGFTKQAMSNLLSKMGIPPQVDFKSRNVAAVMVTANLPPFVKSGQKFDVNVSSLGDATSLKGGTLLLTPLYGADNNIYATAQGNISINQDDLMPNISPVRNSNSTAGRIPSGALVEKEVPVSILEKGALTIVLNDPDFTTATRIADAITESGLDAQIFDAGTVKVSVSDTQDPLRSIANIESITIVPDVVAKVIINERTGTVVMGENVKIAACAVSYGGIDVTVGPVNLYSEKTFDDFSNNADTLRLQTSARVKKSENMLNIAGASAKLADVVKALNSIKARPQELIAILQAMKKAGALKAELEII